MGPDRGKHLRNIAIILALAVAVWLVPGGDTAANTIGRIIGIVFMAGLLFFGYRLYMEHRETILDLAERQRGMLYASLALIVIALVATSRMWDEGGLGAMLWLAFVAAGIWGIFSVWRAYREY